MERKQILKALKECYGVDAKYMGALTFDYQIEIEGKKYVVDREGKITNEDGDVFELLNSEPANEISPFRVSLDGHTGITLRNLLNMIYSKQTLIKTALSFEDEIVTQDFIKTLNDAEVKSVEDFKRIVNKDKLKGIAFDFEEGVIMFNFCSTTDSPEKIEANNQFISFINNTAKELKHASPKVTVTDNAKFTMRTWLLRLGFIGPEYKQTRKVLLKNLDGNGAFRKTKAS